ncbi:hypothetical protein [Mucilaginibacter humi]|uniref:hypothetical protein n=1 Tax=Mucilaginibacter humi TaxID=2732510 RepID=UPI001FE4D9BF|nr:hypothetical protein [Mucilaginibacter humi]
MLQKSERTWIDAVINFNHIEKAIYTVSSPPEHIFSDIDFMLDVNSGLDNWEQHWQIPIREAAKKKVYVRCFPASPAMKWLPTGVSIII